MALHIIRLIWSLEPNKMTRSLKISASMSLHANKSSGSSISKPSHPDTFPHSPCKDRKRSQQRSHKWNTCEKDKWFQMLASLLYIVLSSCTNVDQFFAASCLCLQFATIQPRLIEKCTHWGLPCSCRNPTPEQGLSNVLQNDCICTLHFCCSQGLLSDIEYLHWLPSPICAWRALLAHPVDWFYCCKGWYLLGTTPAQHFGHDPNCLAWLHSADTGCFCLNSSFLRPRLWL